jgi:hypothetical protein
VAKGNRGVCEGCLRRPIARTRRNGRERITLLVPPSWVRIPAVLAVARMERKHGHAKALAQQTGPRPRARLSLWDM